MTGIKPVQTKLSVPCAAAAAAAYPKISSHDNIAPSLLFTHPFINPGGDATDTPSCNLNFFALRYPSPLEGASPLKLKPSLDTPPPARLTPPTSDGSPACTLFASQSSRMAKPSAPGHEPNGTRSSLTSRLQPTPSSSLIPPSKGVRCVYDPVLDASLSAQQLRKAKATYKDISLDGDVDNAPPSDPRLVNGSYVGYINTDFNLPRSRLRHALPSLPQWPFNAVTDLGPGPPTQIVVSGFDPLTPFTQVIAVFSAFGDIAHSSNKLHPETGSFLGFATFRYRDTPPSRSRPTPTSASDAALQAVKSGNGRRIGARIVRVQFDAKGHRSTRMINACLERATALKESQAVNEAFHPPPGQRPIVTPNPQSKALPPPSNLVARPGRVIHSAGHARQPGTIHVTGTPRRPGSPPPGLRASHPGGIVHGATSSLNGAGVPPAEVSQRNDAHHQTLSQAQPATDGPPPSAPKGPAAQRAPNVTPYQRNNRSGVGANIHALLRSKHYIFIASTNVPYVSGIVKHMQNRLRGFQFEDIYHNRAGYFIVFPLNPSGWSEAQRCFRLCNGKEFFTYRLNMQLFVVSNADMSPQHHSHTRVSSLAVPLIDPTSPGLQARKESVSLARHDIRRRDEEADIEEEKKERARNFDPVVEATDRIRRELREQLIQRIHTHISAPNLHKFLDPSNPDLLEKKRQHNIADFPLLAGMGSESDGETTPGTTVSSKLHPFTRLDLFERRAGRHDVNSLRKASYRSGDAAKRRVADSVGARGRAVRSLHHRMPSQDRSERGSEDDHVRGLSRGPSHARDTAEPESAPVSRMSPDEEEEWGQRDDESMTEASFATTEQPPATRSRKRKLGMRAEAAVKRLRKSDEELFGLTVDRFGTESPRTDRMVDVMMSDSLQPSLDEAQDHDSQTTAAAEPSESSIAFTKPKKKTKKQLQQERAALRRQQVREAKERKAAEAVEAAEAAAEAEAQAAALVAAAAQEEQEVNEEAAEAAEGSVDTAEAEAAKTSAATPSECVEKSGAVRLKLVAKSDPPTLLMQKKLADPERFRQKVESRQVSRVVEARPPILPGFTLARSNISSLEVSLMDMPDVSKLSNRFRSKLMIESPELWLWHENRMRLINTPPTGGPPSLEIEGYYVPSSTGSARTDGVRKILNSEKAKYLPHHLRVQQVRQELNQETAKAPKDVDIKKEVGQIMPKHNSRANRANNRRVAAELNGQKKAFGETPDVLRFNQLQKRKKPVKFARSAIHNWGLFTLEDIPKDDMIIEYVGEKVRQQISDIREQRYLKSGIGSSYLFRIDDNWVIDATKKGGVARFINHSCQPNCKASIVRVEGTKRIVIYALRDIKSNEELTYDYKFEREIGAVDRIPCLCGTRACKGFLN